MIGSAVNKPRLTKEVKTIVSKTGNFGSASNSSSPAQERSDRLAPREWCGSPSKTPNKNQKRVTIEIRTTVCEIFRSGWRSSQIIQRTELHASVHYSPESDLEYPTKVVSKPRKHSIYIHFPKRRNCEVCLSTKMTRALCRRRNGEALPRAKKMTADHKVLNEGCESRDNHRYAVVVQDLATQWIQSYPCKTKTSQENGKEFAKFLEASHKPKVICTDNSLECGKSCEDLSRNHRTSIPHSAVLLQSGLDEDGGLILWNAIAICEMSKTSWQMGKSL